MSIPSFSRLQELLRLVPKGEWHLQDGINLIDPDGHHFTLTSSDSSVLKERLYAELFLEIILCVTEMFQEIEYQRKRLDGTFKELRHMRERSRIRQVEGVAMALHIIQKIEPEGPTARDALATAVTELKELINGIQTDKRDAKNFVD
jgi:hypothetical protein